MSDGINAPKYDVANRMFADASARINRDRDLAEFLRLTKLGYRFVESDLPGMSYYLDPFAEGPVRYQS